MEMKSAGNRLSLAWPPPRQGFVKLNIYSDHDEFSKFFIPKSMEMEPVGNRLSLV